MTETQAIGRDARQRIDPAKFRDPARTVDGTERASVTLSSLQTLWFATGTLCNLECKNCYIESSPTNDRLVYLTLSDVTAFLDEIAERKLGTREVGFTGGEPFMNPEILNILDTALSRSFKVLVLTNAMQPMQRPHIKSGLRKLLDRHNGQFSLRVSLDHYTREVHEDERGPGSWQRTIDGLRWLLECGFSVSVAGRALVDEPESNARAGYQTLFAAEGLAIDPYDPSELVIFPEMDASRDVPEITVDCWSRLGKAPEDIMCSTSRMVVKRKGALAATVVACTLLPYDKRFELGASLAEADRTVRLNHPHCARFCVLGGATCSGS